ncbi:hypothetical protein [Croceicoccus gelatinilyticus]|uniref:hypothetical protein n=1 Tax=Croceicoccus gelatinilyticus TaxID=2835536 RepID=UPI001BCFB725|nr:hypothetical protein [Croceicoccus gelatinilyticus]MBS7671511.1 hypothetical protein [Croceicoccus gelatinilyticus]
MTSDDFNAWLDHLSLNNQQAGERLGISRNTVARYRLEGAPASIGLACSAIAMNLPPWKQY